eukprot:6492701-Amphidinium_carterae.2
MSIRIDAFGAKIKQGHCLVNVKLVSNEVLQCATAIYLMVVCHALWFPMEMVFSDNAVHKWECNLPHFGGQLIAA